VGQWGRWFALVWLSSGASWAASSWSRIKTKQADEQGPETVSGSRGGKLKRFRAGKPKAGRPKRAVGLSPMGFNANGPAWSSTNVNVVHLCHFLQIFSRFSISLLLYFLHYLHFALLSPKANHFYQSRASATSSSARRSQSLSRVVHLADSFSPFSPFSLLARRLWCARHGQRASAA